MSMNALLIAVRWVVQPLCMSWCLSEQMLKSLNEVYADCQFCFINPLVFRLLYKLCCSELIEVLRSYQLFPHLGSSWSSFRRTVLNCKISTASVSGLLTCETRLLTEVVSSEISSRKFPEISGKLLITYVNQLFSSTALWRA